MESRSDEQIAKQRNSLVSYSFSIDAIEHEEIIYIQIANPILQRNKKSTQEILKDNLELELRSQQEISSSLRIQAGQIINTIPGVL